MSGQTTSIEQRITGLLTQLQQCATDAERVKLVKPIYKQGDQLEHQVRALQLENTELNAQVSVLQENVRSQDQQILGQASTIDRLTSVDTALRQEGQDLQSRLDTVNSRRQIDLAESAASAARIVDLEDRIAQLLANPTPTTNEALQVVKVHKSEPYRIQEKFTGKEKSKYEDFQRQVKLAIALNGDRYPTLQSKISLIYQNLGPSPQSFLNRHMTDDGVFTLSSIQAVWDCLDTSYKNWNAEEDARNELKALKQDDNTYGEYLAEFERLRLIANLYDDPTLISYMKAGVTRRLRTNISNHQDVRKKYSFDEYVELCKECQMRLDLDRAPPRPTHVPTNQPRNPSNPPEPRLGAYATRSPATGSNTTPLGDDRGDPMILDRVHLGPDGKLTAVERERRMVHNLCLRCGKAGHRASDCTPLRVRGLNIEDGMSEN